MHRDNKANKQLPIYLLAPQEHVAPSEVLRSALFGIGSRRERQQFTEHPIFTCGETKITYTGQSLDQGDLDIFMAAVRMAYDNGKSFELKCSIYAFQRMLGLAIGKSSRDRIKASFKRLTSGTIMLKNDRYQYYGHLIDSFSLDKRSDRYDLTLNPKLSQLFRDGYTRIDWQRRLKIRSDLGKRLQALILSHKAPSKRPQRYTTETLKKLCGSTDADESRFKTKVRRHMREFRTDGQVKSWTLQGNILYYTRT